MLAQGPILFSPEYLQGYVRYNIPQSFSPEASSLGEYGNIPVNLSSGIPSIVVPLTELSGKNCTIPISLSYLASGHKTEAHPGCVGLGWTLQAGGCINRIVHGYKDEISREESAYAQTLVSSNPDYLPINLPDPGYYYHSQSVQRAANSDVVLDSLLFFPGLVDYEPDEFQMNLFGKTVSFFIGNDGVPVVRNDAGEYYKVQIDTTNTKNTPYLFWSSGQHYLNAHHFCYFSKFTVTDKSGTRYEFGGSLDAIDFSYVQMWVSDPGPHIVGTANTWYLTRIVTQDGEAVDFSYQKMGYPVVVTDIQTKISVKGERWSRNVTMHDPWQCDQGITTIEDVFTQEYADPYGLSPVFSNFSYTFLRPSYLVSIQNQTVGKQLSFSYSPSYGLDNLINPDYMMLNFGQFGAGEGVYFNLSSFLEEPRYYKLDIVQNGGKYIRFDYLFTRPGTQTQGLMRLRLDAVRVTQQSETADAIWRFHYNDLFLPAYNSKMSDHWGYYNGQYYGAAFKQVSSGWMTPAFISAVAESMSGCRTPNAYCQQAELLKEIEYPTGGVTKLEYEPNDYHLVVGDGLTLEQETGMAGGVRIKSITDSIPGNASLRTFLYHDSGILRGRPKYLIRGDEHQTGIYYSSGLDIFEDQEIQTDTLVHFAKSSEQCMNRPYGEPPVAYTRVTEVFSDGSRIEHHFSGYDDYPDSLRKKVRGQFAAEPPDGFSPNTSQIIPDLPVLDNSHLRGRPESEVYFNAAGDTVRKKEYRYEICRDAGPVISIHKSVVSSRANIRKIAVTSIPINHLALIEETDKEYFPYGLSRTQTTEYGYDRFGNITGRQVSVPGDAVTGTRTMFCSADSLMWPYGPYSSMRAANVLDRPVEVLHLRDGKVVAAQLTTYKKEGDVFVPDKEYEAELETPADTSSWIFYRPDYMIPEVYGKVRRHYRAYDNFGNPTAVMEGASGGTMLKWSANGTYPLAQFDGAGPRTEVSYAVGTEQKHQSLRAITNRCALVRFEVRAIGGTELTVWFDEGEERSCYVKLDTAATYYYHPKPAALPPGVRDHFTYEIQGISEGWHTFQVALTPDDFYSIIPDAVPNLPGTHYFLADADIIYPVPSYQESVATLPVLYEDFETNGNVYTDGFESNRSNTGSYTVGLDIPAGVDYQIDWLEKSNGEWRYKFSPFTGSKTLGAGASAIDNVRVYPVGTEVTSWTWWPTGKLRSATNERGESVRYRYDCLDRLVSVIDKDGNPKTDYGYEYVSAGNSLPRNAVTTTQYTSAGTNPTSRVVEQHLDGLGRLSSMVRKGASPVPGGGDLRDSCWYDANGRLVRKGLPVPVGNQAFYGTEEEPYSVTIYDGSPLNRPSVEYGPGKAWHDADRGLRTLYLTNDFSDSLSCKKWSVSWALDTLMTVSSPGLYPAGTLRATHVRDEDGHTLIRFVDLEDKPILERGVLRESGGPVQFADTYYVYDPFGRLAAVLPPELSHSLSSSALSSWSCQTSLQIRQFAYLYRYDAKGRCVAKKLPGCGWTLMAYDRNDRLVFTQDPVRREHSQWQYVIPDERGRECLSGILRNETLNPFDDPFNAWPIYVRRSDDDVFGYEVAGYDISSNTVQRVRWWDDYRFLGKWGVPSGTDPRTSLTASTTLMSGGGLPTGELNAILGGGNVNSYLWKVHYYDGFGRELQTNMQTPGSIEKEMKSYDFLGNVTGRVLSHLDTGGQQVLKETYTYGYDAWSRPTTVYHRLGQYGLNVCLRSNNYDAVGRLNGCTRASNSALTESIYHNVRSWPDSLLVGGGGNLFRQGTDHSWGGNISSLNWTSAEGTGTVRYDFTYDGLSRLQRALFTPVSGNQRRTVWTYDRNGNMTNEEDVDITSFGRILPVGSTAYILRGNRMSMKFSSLEGGLLPLRAGLDTLSGPIIPIIDPLDNFTYDACGRLISDANRGMQSISYNALGLPMRIEFGETGASSLYYFYSADGSKLEQGTIVPAAGFGQSTYVPHITYRGTLVYVDGMLDRILIEGGYISASDNAYHFFITDHLGSVRAVAASDGTVERRYDYKPYGEDLNANALPDYPSPNPYKFSGKEWDEELGSYDFSARLYSPLDRRWTAMDPQCEKYYSISPYAYCAGNPENVIDPQGDTIIVSNMGYIREFFGDDKRVFIGSRDGLRYIGMLGGYIDANIIYSNLLSSSIDEYRFLNPVKVYEYMRNHGRDDLKNNKQYIYGLANDGKTRFMFRGDFMTSQDIGNHHYGVATKTNFFISESFALRMAGWAQNRANTSMPEWNFGKIGSFSLFFPYGDDPKDQYWIMKGFEYVKKNRK